MPDFGDEEYHGMVCVEAGNVGENKLTLASGKDHRPAGDNLESIRVAAFRRNMGIPLMQKPSDIPNDEIADGE